MDGSTDTGNIDEEMFLVLYCDVNSDEEQVYTKISFFSIERPDTVTAAGLFQCLQSALKRIAIAEIGEESCKRFVGVGTDRASANIAASGLRGLVQEKVPWVFWMWCIAHRLELSLRDGLKRTEFDIIDEMLLRLYYIYENSPKNAEN